MMLNLRLIFLYTNYYNYLFIVVFFSLFFVFELCLFIYSGSLKLNIFLYDFQYNPYYFFIKLLNIDNITLIGTVLFNFYFLLFIFLGILLLVAMICVIVLILELEHQYEEDNIIKQIIYIKKTYDN